MEAPNTSRFLLLGLLFYSACAYSYYDEYVHKSEKCKPGMYMRPHCFATPCMLDTTCKNYPDAECSNSYCRDAMCHAVWRHKGKVVDCGNNDYSNDEEYQDDWDWRWP